MTSAEENVLRAAVNPWWLSLARIAKAAGRSQDTTRKHLRTLHAHGLVMRSRNGHWMATSSGVRALADIDRMRES